MNQPISSLDLRPGAATQHEWLPLLVVDDTRTVPTGRVRGYTVEVQARRVPQRKDQGDESCRVRLTAPDGRRVTLVVDARRAGPGSELAGHALSPIFRSIIEHTLAPDQHDEAEAAVEAALSEGIACLREGAEGMAALFRVGAAVVGVAPEQMAAFDVHPHSAVSRVLRSGLRVADIGWLIRAGFTPGTAADWFGVDLTVVSEANVQAMAAFRDNGWKGFEVRAFEGRLRAQARDAGRGFVTPSEHDDALWPWSVVLPEQAWLAMQCGLTVQRTLDLIESGRWDHTALTALAALRSGEVLNTSR